MISIEWNEEAHATGNPVLDGQHKHLMELANALVRSGLSDGRSPFYVRLLELFGYAFYHFRTEERLMAKRGLSERDIEAHASAHDTISEYLLSLLRDFGAGVAMDSARIASVFLDWFENHEKAFDSKDFC